MTTHTTAEKLLKGDTLIVFGKTYIVTDVEWDKAKTVVMVSVVGHSPFAYDYGQKVRVA